MASSPHPQGVWHKLQTAAMKILCGPPELSTQVDILTATIPDLKALLDEGNITSVGLVKLYASQINKQNQAGLKLKAVISVVPEQLLFEQAKLLDEERASGKLRSQLHGIPFLTKDTMWTASTMGVASSCGTAALKHSMAHKNAAVVQQLLDAGMILMGKANLSELGGAKSSEAKGGSSAAGGQGQSAYVIGGVDPSDTLLGHSTPAGSSSGSAVAVSAGMAPLTLGTESDGSLIIPADRASIYSLKPTHGTISNHGSLAFAAVSDTIGTMGKGPADIALSMNVLLDGDTDYTKLLGGSLAGLKIGFIDPEEWSPGAGAIRPSAAYTEQSLKEFRAAIDKVEENGAIVHRNISLHRFSSDDADKLYHLTWRDYAQGFTEFTNGLIDAPVHSLAELATWNSQHPEDAMPPECPGQSAIEDIASRHISEVQYLAERTQLQTNNKDALDKTMDEYDIDFIVGPPTGRLITVIDVAGLPVGSLPVGYAEFNGRPFGFCCAARQHREDLVIKLMGSWYNLFGPPTPPPQLTQGQNGKPSL